MGAADDPDNVELRASPCGRLWSSVVLASLDDLRESIVWWRDLEPTWSARMQKAWSEDRRRLHKKLRQERHRQTQRLASAVWYFTAGGSSFSWTCDVLGYDRVDVLDRLKPDIESGQVILSRRGAAVMPRVEAY